MTGKKNNLIDRDIHDRIADEDKLVLPPKKERDHGRLPQIIIGIVIAAIALFGILYPLFN
ncbi:hypothetical protein [Lacticaseibacillus thailandensis]|uniref:Uncharacterized protein n=1 Tax=Lacticaseibacillus thailandensis DSM 22698 = JCM 13996 TaxID=1423810 RepID=A0A0R2C8D8_9LACO|nr:hypothetical protein [Lacticaseibacillus thailandensis]KRM87282.1 hypothetical protein FD19_GL001440 [Lacticaseibacillus thailandensis DSM 22698 = JCM 13996]